MSKLVTVNRALFSEYTKLLAGTIDSFSSSYFGKNHSGSRDKLAQELLHYAFEYFLHWEPKQVADLISYDIIKEMKLDGVIKFLRLPPEVEMDKDYSYIAHLLYPNKIPYDSTKLTIKTYRAVLNGKKDNEYYKDKASLYKFPKGYFNNFDGRNRACVCFRYMMDNFLPGMFNDVEEMYAFFASSKGTKTLNNYMLHTVLRDVFHSPVLYLHDSLPEADKNEFFYHYYEFIYQYNLDEKVLKRNGIIQDKGLDVGATEGAEDPEEPEKDIDNESQNGEEAENENQED